jgi:hypothetical protein
VKFTYGGVDFEGTAAECHEFMDARDAERKPFMAVADQPVDLTASVAPTAPVAPPQEGKKRSVRKNPNSLFYATDRKHFKPDVADTYDYVAAYKKGRTITDVKNKFGVSRACANQRLLSLTRDGLLKRLGRGVYVTAYPDEGFDNATPEQIALFLAEKVPC